MAKSIGKPPAGNVETPPSKGAKGTAVNKAIGEMATFDNKENKADIVKGFEAMRNLEDKRSQNNAELSAIRKSLASKGMSMHALKHAYSLWKMEEPKRHNYGETMGVVDDALQMGLFPEDTRSQEGEKPTTARSKPAKKPAARVPAKGEKPKAAGAAAAPEGVNEPGHEHMPPPKPEATAQSRTPQSAPTVDQLTGGTEPYVPPRPQLVN